MYVVLYMHIMYMHIMVYIQSMVRWYEDGIRRLLGDSMRGGINGFSPYVGIQICIWHFNHQLLCHDFFLTLDYRGHSSLSVT